MSKVFTIGEILVEIMASKIGQPFDQRYLERSLSQWCARYFYRPGDTSWRSVRHH